MGKLEDAERVVVGLSAAEKAQLVQSVVRELSDIIPGIESNATVCGGEAYIARTRIPVWVLEQARRLGTSEAELLRAYPALKAADLVNAWAYVDKHRDDIDLEIRENEDAN